MEGRRCRHVWRDVKKTESGAEKTTAPESEKWRRDAHEVKVPRRIGPSWYRKRAEMVEIPALENLATSYI